ncbi:MAG: Rnf-Nqr domain containing protein, partial [Anaerovoracaceae bacterium]
MNNEILTIIISMVFVDNLLLTKAMALGPALTLARQSRRTAVLGLIITICMLLATIGSWCFEHYILLPNNLYYMRIMTFILVVYLVAYVIGLSVRKIAPNYAAGMNNFSSLVLANAAVLGIALIVSDNGYNLKYSII